VTPNPEEQPVKPLLALAAALALTVPAFAESRSVLLVATHDKDGEVRFAIHSDDRPDGREAASVEEACRAVAAMKGWGSSVNVYVVADRKLDRKDRKALFDAVDANHWLDLSYYGPEAPKSLAEHFLKGH
jgi:hypothetical protein